MKRYYPRLIGGPKAGESVMEAHFDRPRLRVAILEEFSRSWEVEDSTSAGFRTEDYVRHVFASKDSEQRLFYFAHESLSGPESGVLLWEDMLDHLGAMPRASESVRR